MNDAVNRPSHYTGFSHGSEPIDIAEHLRSNGSHAVGYITRATRSGFEKLDPLEDLDKAIFYLQREKALLRSQGAKYLHELDEEEFMARIKKFYGRD